MHAYLSIISNCLNAVGYEPEDLVGVCSHDQNEKFPESLNYQNVVLKIDFTVDREPSSLRKLPIAGFNGCGTSYSSSHVFRCYGSIYLAANKPKKKTLLL